MHSGPLSPLQALGHRTGKSSTQATKPGTGCCPLRMWGEEAWRAENNLVCGAGREAGVQEKRAAREGGREQRARLN